MKRWKRIGAALLCAAILTGTGAARAAAAELDTEEPAQTETQAAGIVTAAALDGADTAYSFTQRPALEELLEQFPDTILLTLEGQEEPVEVAVSWCSQVDYEDTDFYYYMFEAQWDEDAYPRAETLTDGDLPVLDVFLAEMEGGSGESGIMTASTSGNESTIYTYLTDTLGLNTAAACGVLANMYTESGLDPTITGSGGYYGLCQWSSTRLTNLKSLYPSNYDTVSGQMGFTAQELGGLWDSAVKTSSYLRSVPNTEEGASNAAYYFAKYFEGCSSSTYASRQRLATDTYWAKYGDSSTSTVTISGYTLPVTMTTGTSFTVSGTLSSSKTITKVTAGCYTKSGDKVSGCYESVTPNATSYDLSSLDDDLLFSQLSPGIYKYKVTATTSAGTETVFSLTFTVLAKAATVSDGSYYIYSTQNTGNAVAVEDDSASANANIELASGSGTTAQKFKITYVSSGYYKIINASSGLALTVKNGTPITGTNVRQESYDGDDNQLWQILPTGSDSYCLVPKCATQCCLASAGSSSGSNIRISTESLSAAQCWTLSTSSLLATPVLSGVTGTSSGVTVEWEAVSGAAKYRVFRKVSGGSWTKLTDTTSTSYTDTTA
ncbi:MAG: phage tail tip lysozyme, partial [Clostridiales bacterium]|nr:phage tail tip lysozyme [Clostridiales bacterium]